MTEHCLPNYCIDETAFPVDYPMEKYINNYEKNDILFWILMDWKDYAENGIPTNSSWLSDKIWGIIKIALKLDRCSMRLLDDIDTVLGKYYKGLLNKGSSAIKRRAAKRYFKTMLFARNHTIHKFIMKSLGN
jgi:hypothetical protein